MDYYWVRALMVPMHLGLIDRPFMSHNLSTQEGPFPLPKFQMAPRLKILMFSGSKKGTKIYFFFSLKNPGKRTPSRFPNRVSMERDIRLQGILHIASLPLTTQYISVVFLSHIKTTRQQPTDCLVLAYFLFFSRLL